MVTAGGREPGRNIRDGGGQRVGRGSFKKAEKYKTANFVIYDMLETGTRFVSGFALSVFF